MDRAYVQSRIIGQAQFIYLGANPKQPARRRQCFDWCLL